MLGRKEDTYFGDYIKGYKIYIHEKGQFWPGLETEQIGMDEPLFLKIKKELTASFLVTEKINLNLESSPCVEDQSYSFNECIFTYIATGAGCLLDWVPSDPAPRFSGCVTKKQILLYNEKLKSAINLPWAKLVEESGCHPKCLVKSYILTKTSEEDITWRHDWSSSFFINAEKTLIRTDEELLAFDLPDMINGIGGALGLYLGWSLLYMVAECVSRAAGVRRWLVGKFCENIDQGLEGDRNRNCKALTRNLPGVKYPGSPYF